MKTERRHYPRVTLPVFYRIPAHSPARRQVQNLSLGGVRIYSDVELDIGQMLELEFFLPNGMTIDATAKVVWVKSQPPGSAGVFDVGLQFIDLAKVAEIELASILNED
jgi:c-di-GMP-binding flagellar brake protein YcgR